MVETKVTTPEKIVHYKCCLPNSNISMKEKFNVVTFPGSFCNSFAKRETKCTINKVTAEF